MSPSRREPGKFGNLLRVGLRQCQLAASVALETPEGVAHPYAGCSAVYRIREGQRANQNDFCVLLLCTQQKPGAMNRIRLFALYTTFDMEATQKSQ